MFALLFFFFPAKFKSGPQPIWKFIIFPSPSYENHITHSQFRGWMNTSGYTGHWQNAYFQVWDHTGHIKKNTGIHIQLLYLRFCHQSACVILFKHQDTVYESLSSHCRTSRPSVALKSSYESTISRRLFPGVFVKNHFVRFETEHCWGKVGLLRNTCWFQRDCDAMVLALL